LFNFNERSFLSIEPDEKEFLNPNYLAFSGDGKRPAGINKKYRNFLVWDARTGQRLQSFKVLEADQVEGIALNHHATRLASIDSGGMVTLWDVDTGQKVLSLKTSQVGRRSSDNPIAFSPDGERLAVACEDEVGVWSAVPFQDDLALSDLMIQ
jgi:WD40 repeat protein